MLKRSLGRTGRELSVIGFGGIVVKDVSPDDATAYVSQAIGRGIDYFDVAPGYGDAEEKLGPALAPYREDVFLACKTAERTAEGAEADLQRSLSRLQTDCFDLYQMHNVGTQEEAEQVLAPGGALETLIAARERGLARHLGFSAHSEEAALRLLRAFDFDSILFPINRWSWNDGGFGPRVIAEAASQKIGILALKALAKRPRRESDAGRWPKCWYMPVETQPEAEAALAFTLTEEVTAAVCPGHVELLWLACDAAEALEAGEDGTPLPAAEGEPLFVAEG